MIVVRLYAGLRKTAGVKEISLDADSLRAALDALIARFPGLQHEVWDSSRLRPYLVITLNGHNLHDAADLDKALSPGDVIAIFPPITGGFDKSGKGDV